VALESITELTLSNFPEVIMQALQERRTKLTPHQTAYGAWHDLDSENVH